LNKFAKNIIVIIAFLITIILISSSSLSANLNNISVTKNSLLEITEEDIPIVVETSTGLAPISVSNNKESINNDNLPVISLAKSERMWGYIANSNIYDEGTCYFPLEDPGTIEFFQDTESDDFLSGGTGSTDERWLACRLHGMYRWRRCQS
jgi:hypothetical protein